MPKQQLKLIKQKKNSRNNRKNGNRKIRTIIKKPLDKLRDIRIKHNGILSSVDVTGGTSSATSVQSLNPGFVSFNEWLSQLAILYE